MTGQTISHYRIAEKLGEGGMGVVYKAEDTQLRRAVALKFLAQQGLNEPETKARLIREAQAAASLDHPHICSVYGIHEEGGHTFIAMAYVDGVSLADKIKQRPLAFEQALGLAIQIGEGLQEAHEQGVVHRDIKPANIMLTRKDRVKIMDFGLAYLAGRSKLTKSGTTLGTPVYMSPEQALGQPADRRSDIWSLGVVLYEMIAGQPPFNDEHQQAIIYSIINEAPEPLTARRTGLPVEIDRIIGKVLAKKPDERYQHVDDMLVDLQTLSRRHTSSSGPGFTAKPKVGSLRKLLVAAAAVLLVAIAVAWRLWEDGYFWQNPLDGAKIERLTDFSGDESDAAISRDGRFVIFVSNQDGQVDAWTGQIGSRGFINITNGRASTLNFGGTPRVGFSADGTHVWITDGARPGHYTTSLAPAVGGAPNPYLSLGGNPTWSPDGAMIAYHTNEPGDPIFVAERNGSNPKRIFAEKPGMHCHFITWSPDGRFIYFVKGSPNTEEMDIWRIPVSGSVPAPERITSHNAQVAYPAWLDERTLIYSATAGDGSGQWLYSVDVERRTPRRVSAGVTEQYQSVAASSTIPRRLVAAVASPSSTLWTIPISERVQTEEAATHFAVPNARSLAPSFAPDYLLFLSSMSGGNGLWKLVNGTARELWNGRDGGVVDPPAVSPDGNLICFSYRNHGRAGLYLMNADGTGIRLLTDSLDVRGAASWSPDGKWITVAASQETGTRIFKVPTDGGQPVQLLDVLSYNPVWSPDGGFIVYSEQQGSGQFEVKAITPNKASVPISEIQVGYSRSTPYRFVPNRKALIYLRSGISLEQNFFLVDLETGNHRRLTDLKPLARIQNFDVSPDGSRIVFDRLRENSDIVMMDLVR